MKLIFIFLLFISPLAATGFGVFTTRTYWGFEIRQREVIPWTSQSYTMPWETLWRRIGWESIKMCQ